MRVLLASVEDPRDVRSWSGRPFSLVEGLRAGVVDVESASPLRERLVLPPRREVGRAMATTSQAPDAGDGDCRLLLVGRGWERKGADLAVTPLHRAARRGARLLRVDGDLAERFRRCWR